MMIFVVDIGNSHTVTGVYKDNRLIAQWRLKSDKERTVDEIAFRYSTLFNMVEIDAKEIQHVVISSVVPSLEASWVKCCKQYFPSKNGNDPFVVSDISVKSLIKIAVDNPAEVGADRLVNAIAALDIYKHDLVVIDFGTAITFDCVSKRCEYIGGAILPGLNLSLEALSSKAAKLPHIDISKPPEKVIGTNTISAMKSGILYGYGSMIDGLVASIKNEMIGKAESTTPFKVIATGGIAELISPYSKSIDVIEPMLTIKGLKLIHDLAGKS